MFDTPPENADELNIVLIRKITTPLGPMFAAATPNGLSLLEFADRKMLESELQDLCKRLKAKIVLGNNNHLDQTEQQISEYFAGTRTEFHLSIDAPGTIFQQKVWDHLRLIPYGTTNTYKSLAKEIDNPKGIRAVAKANGYNRISIVIPCHRIIGSDDNLTGYGGGLPRKKWLLDHEQKNHTTGQKHK